MTAVGQCVLRLTEIDDNLEAMVTCPGDGLIEEGYLSLVVRFPSADVERPVAYGQPDVVKTRVTIR